MYSIRDKKMSRNILLISISIFILAGFIYFSNSAYAGGKDMMLANAISGVSPLNKNITGVQSDDIMSGLKDKISGESAGLLDLRDRLKELKDPRINRIDGLRAGDKDVTETTIRLGGRIFIFPGLLPAGYLSSIMGSKDLFPVVIRIAFANGNRDQREITTNIWCFGEGWELLYQGNIKEIIKYNKQGEIIERNVLEKRNDIVVYEYTYLRSENPERGHSEEIAWTRYDDNGNKTNSHIEKTFTNENGCKATEIEEKQYDQNGDVVYETSTRTTYDVKGRMLENYTISKGWGQETINHTSIIYDAAGNVVKQKTYYSYQDTNWNYGYESVTYLDNVYDEQGRLIKTENTSEGWTGYGEGKYKYYGSTNISEYTYNTNSEQLLLKYRSEYVNYDANGNESYRSVTEQSRVYDSEFRLLESVYKSTYTRGGQTTTDYVLIERYEYDSQGRLIKEYRFYDSSWREEETTITYQYDAKGRLAEKKEEGYYIVVYDPWWVRVTKNVFNEFDKLAGTNVFYRIWGDEAKTKLMYASDRIEEYSYDAAGNLTHTHIEEETSNYNNGELTYSYKYVYDKTEEYLYDDAGDLKHRHVEEKTVYSYNNEANYSSKTVLDTEYFSNKGYEEIERRYYNDKLSVERVTSYHLLSVERVGDLTNTGSSESIIVGYLKNETLKYFDDSGNVRNIFKNTEQYSYPDEKLTRREQTEYTIVNGEEVPVFEHKEDIDYYPGAGRKYDNDQDKDGIIRKIDYYVSDGVKTRNVEEKSLYLEYDEMGNAIGRKEAYSYKAKFNYDKDGREVYAYEKRVGYGWRKTILYDRNISLEKASVDMIYYPFYWQPYASETERKTQYGNDGRILYSYNETKEFNNIINESGAEELKLVYHTISESKYGKKGNLISSHYMREGYQPYYWWYDRILFKDDLMVQQDENLISKEFSIIRPWPPYYYGPYKEESWTNNEYHKNGKLKKEELTTKHYDEMGNIIRDYSSKTEYDEHGRLVKMHQQKEGEQQWYWYGPIYYRTMPIEDVQRVALDGKMVEVKDFKEPEYVKYLKFLDADCRPNDFDYKYEYDVTLQYGKDGNVVMTAYYKAWNKNSEGELELSFSYTGMFYFKDGKLVSSHEQKNGKRQDLGIIWYADGPLQPVYTTNAEIMYKKTLEDAPDVQAEEVAAGIDQSTPSSVLDDIARWGAVRDSAAQRKSTGSYSIQEPKLEPIELFK